MMSRVFHDASDSATSSVSSASASRSAPPSPRRAIVVSSAGFEKHEPVVQEHVVGVQLFRQHDLHTLAEVAQRLPRGLVGAEQHDQDAGSAGIAVGAAGLVVDRRRLGRRPGGRAQTEVAEELHARLRLRLGYAPVVDDDDLAFGARSESAERRASRTIFLGVRCE